jgi:hypothetical protein
MSALLKTLPDLRLMGKVAIDCEGKDEGLAADRGSGWPWRGGHVSGISAAWREGGTLNSGYIPIAHPDSECFDRACVAAWLRDLLASDTDIIFHNAPYDLGWLCTDLDIAFPSPDRLHDTCAVATLVDENQRTLRLDDLCRWRGIPGKDERALIEACAAAGLIPKGRKKLVPQEHIWKLPASAVAGYAAADPAATLRLFESIGFILDIEGTRDAYRTDIALLPMIHAMRRRGIRIDLDAAVQALTVVREKRDGVLAQISELVGAAVSMIEVRGRKWLTAIHDRFGIAYPRTEKGNPSFKGGALGWMKYHPHPLPQLIAAAHKYDHYAETFIGGQIIGAAVNGRIHADIHPFRSDDGGPARAGSATAIRRCSRRPSTMRSLRRWCAAASCRRKAAIGVKRTLHNRSSVSPYTMPSAASCHALKKYWTFCLKNNRAKGLLNGTTWKVVEATADGRGFYDMVVESGDNGRIVHAVSPIATFGLENGDGGKYPCDPFDWGYVMTCHKSQGSQWESVCLIDESYCWRRDNQHRNWLYTGITRAAKRIVIVM